MCIICDELHDQLLKKVPKTITDVKHVHFKLFNVFDNLLIHMNCHDLHLQDTEAH